MTRYRVFVAEPPFPEVWTSATFPHPDITDSWIGAVLRAARMSLAFQYVRIERVGVKR